MTHQPPDWLTEQSRQDLNGEIATPGAFVAHLFGHMHEAGYSVVSAGGGDGRCYWQGRSLFGLEPSLGVGQQTSRLHGYSAGRIEFESRTASLSFWPREVRRLMGGEWKMVPDLSFNLTRNNHTPPLVISLHRHIASTGAANKAGRIDPEPGLAHIDTLVDPSSSLLYQLRVFLCHSSDDKSTVRDLYFRLLEAGVNPWLDEENILPGQDWQREIAAAVRASDIVLICLSKRSLTKEGYVHKEIRTALDIADEKPDGNTYLIPLRLEDCEVPDRLRRWQWVNYFEDRGYEKLVTSLRVISEARGRATVVHRSHVLTELADIAESEQEFKAVVRLYRQHRNDQSGRVAADQELGRGRGRLPIHMLRALVEDGTEDPETHMAVAVSAGVVFRSENQEDPVRLLGQLLASGYERVRYRAAGSLERRAGSGYMSQPSRVIALIELSRALATEDAPIVQAALEQALAALTANKRR